MKTKLKTLQELKPNVYNSDGLGFYREDILKAEAIKWIKEDYELVTDLSSHKMLERWKNRFNITEEDLENEK